MDQSLSELIALGLGVTASPLAIIAVVLMLTSPSGRASAFAFVAAWAGSLIAVGGAVVLIADGANASVDGGPATWVSLLKLVIAAALVVLGVRQWLGRPEPGEAPELKGWMQQLDTVTPRKAAGFAVLLAAVKPKNLLLAIAAGFAVAQTGAETGEQALSLLLFVTLATLGPGLPLAIAVVMRRRGDGILQRLRVWLVLENARIIAVLCVVIAVKLGFDALSSLLG